jgi:hypothetical protein
MQITIPIDLADRLTAEANRTNTSADELADRYLAEGIEWHQASQPRKFVTWIEALAIAREKMQNPELTLNEFYSNPVPAWIGLRKVDHAHEQSIPANMIFEVIA